jgi:hypothetical protein
MDRCERREEGRHLASFEQRGVADVGGALGVRFAQVA